MSETNILELSKALILAAKKGHHKTVSLLLSHKADVETVDSNWHTALHHAAREGHVDIVSLLIAHGGNIRSHYKLSPAHVRGDEWQLIVAARNSHKLLLVRLILALIRYSISSAEMKPISTCSIEATDHNGFTALHHAVSNGHVHVASMLIANGANVHARSLDGSTPLIIACELGHSDIASLLILHDADINAKHR